MSSQKLNLFNVSEVELKYKSKVNPADRPKITSSRCCYDILAEMWSDDIDYIEEFNILLLNRSNKVIGFKNISKGGTSATIVDAKVIFSAALLSNASSIILSHNHPSGALRASQADIDLTKKIKLAGKVLDISILDHLIVTRYNYYSFADDGKM